MKRPIEHPVVTEEDGPMGGLKYDHPAFAQIGASRISGLATLYGSDFAHQNFVRVRITPSQLRRTLSNDWPFGGVRPYIEVDMSEAQWASFVSSMNVGHGTQCTLRELQGRMVPDLPAPESRRHQFSDEVRAACAEALEAVKELRTALGDAKLSQKARDELVKRANGIENRLVSSLPFVLEMFGEHMEQTVEKAKVEINAYATQTVMRAGIAALGGQAGEVPVLALQEGASNAE